MKDLIFILLFLVFACYRHEKIHPKSTGVILENSVYSLFIKICALEYQVTFVSSVSVQ